MKRRTFLKMLFGAAAAAVAAPVIAEPVEDSVPFKKLPANTIQTRPVEVEVETRRLKARWTMEAQEDLRSMHNLEAERELTQVLADEINKEIDAEVLASIRRIAA